MKGGTPAELRKFAMLRSDVEAVLQRCGLNTFDLILVDLQGDWTRFVFPSEETAKAAANDLGVPLHEGLTDHLTRRVGRDDPWNTNQGRRRAL